ncbi:sugar phosphate isomerase/epimerase family protein [Sphingomonas bacterium]|uniref:sugar phosphate isomerase/epimerase family protein n=1 Tax=Sphingomonas bacterium TaxID=1895847 RepID=UPI00157565C1|nr:sugar phosphate isomerase/epimerase family protein [Sphingomonas bacterium]
MSEAVIDFAFWAAPVRKLSFADHVKAAAAGNFASLAVAPITYDDTLAQGSSAKDMLALAADHGVALRHLDTVTTWAPVQLDEHDFDPEMNRRWRVSVDHALEVCDALGLRQILATAAYLKDGAPLQQLVDGFGALCDRAAARDIWVDLEPMPFFGCPTVADAMAVVGGAGRPNAGVMMDSWHFFKAGQTIANLEAVPGERIRTVQLSDAPRRQIEAKLIDDTMQHRRWPGEGELPLVAFLQALLAKGQIRTISEEVFSLEADAMDAATAGRKAGETTRAVLAAAGMTVAHRMREEAGA